METMETMETTESEKEPCRYKSKRSRSLVCLSEASTPYGFCKKHSRTIQGKKAKEDYERQMEEEYKREMEELNKELQSIEMGDYKAVKKIIFQNKWGNFEEPDTGIVFIPHTKTACGVQRSDGKVMALGKKEKEICEEYGWEYVVSRDLESCKCECPDCEGSCEGDCSECNEEGCCRKS